MSGNLPAFDEGINRPRVDGFFPNPILAISMKNE